MNRQSSQTNPPTQSNIRVRACLAIVRDGRILLVPHYNTDAGPVQWHLPGGRVRFGESLVETARREFQEETELEGCLTSARSFCPNGLGTVSRSVTPERCSAARSRPRPTTPTGRKRPAGSAPTSCAGRRITPSAQSRWH